MRLDVLAAVGAAVFGLACLSPALGAQFVLVDDHEIISYTQTGQGLPLGRLGTLIFASDPADGRFRPMYWLTRLTEVTLLRDNPMAWHGLVLVFGGATAVLLYATARALRFPRTLAVLLSAWVLV